MLNGMLRGMLNRMLRGMLRGMLPVAICCKGIDLERRGVRDWSSVDFLLKTVVKASILSAGVSRTAKVSIFHYAQRFAYFCKTYAEV